jgi:hypothetical protein
MRFAFRIFGTGSRDVVRECLDFFNFRLSSALIPERTIVGVWRSLQDLRICFVLLCHYCEKLSLPIIMVIKDVYKVGRAVVTMANWQYNFQNNSASNVLSA